MRARTALVVPLLLITGLVFATDRTDPEVALRSGKLPPGHRALAIAQADVDGDRWNEILAGCSTPSGGAILAFPVEPGRTTTDPFGLGKPSTVVELPFEPDLLAARCDAAFSPCELWAAERGGTAAAAIRRDPATDRWEAEILELPGTVTALAAGELGIPDGLEEVAIGLGGPEGGAVALVPGALPPADGTATYRTPEPVVVPWPGVPEELVFTREVRPGRGMLAAVAVGRCALLELDETSTALGRTAPPRPRPVPLPDTVTSLLSGPLTANGQAGLAAWGPGGLWLIGPGEEGEEEEDVKTVRVAGTAGPPLAAVRWDGGCWSLVTNSGTVLPLGTAGKTGTAGVPWALPVPRAGRTGAVRAAVRLRRSGRALAPAALLLEDGDAGTVALATPLPRAAFIVDSSADTGDASPGDGVCDDGSGHCTLRAAIEEANAHAGGDAIRFSSDISISPATPLPAITDAVSIDGEYNQVRLFFQSLPAGSNGLVVRADDVTIRNIDVWNVPAGSTSSEGNGIVVEGTLSDRVQNVVITGVWAHSCGRSGIRLASTRSCHIGPGVTLSSNAVGLDQSFWASGNVIEGVVSKSNTGAGLELLVGYDTVVGTCSGGASVSLEKNTWGLLFNSFATGTSVCGSSMGTSPSTGNTVGIAIGANASGGITLTGLIVAGNVSEGIELTRADGSTNPIVIQHSWIGTNAGGATDIGNGDWGVRIESSTGVRLPANVLVEHNGLGGISIEGTSSEPSEDIRIGDANTASGVMIRSNQGPGIQLTEYSADVSIGHVEIASNTGPGVVVNEGSDPDRATIASSSIHDNGDGGVIVNGAKGVEIIGNDITGETVGVGVTGDADVSISRSALASCSQQCIDLGLDGVTANDAGDTDTGPNDLLNFPEIGLARSCGGRTEIPMGWLELDQSAGYTDATVEFWVSDACDATGHGPAEQYIGEELVSAPYGMFSASLFGEYAGKVLTATVSVGKWISGNVIGLTSELSACVTIQPTYGGDADDDCSWDARDLALIVGALYGETLPPGGNADCTANGSTDRADLPCTVNEIFTPHVS